MKKLVVLLLVMVFAIGAAAAEGQMIKISEDQDDFDLYLTLPDSASIIATETEDEYSITDVELGDNAVLDVLVITAPDELYAGMSMKDLSDEDLALIIGWYTGEMAQPSVEYYVSENGHKYAVINENVGGNDSCETVTLINGYHIMISVSHIDFTDLSEAEMAIGASIMETLDVTEK